MPARFRGMTPEQRAADLAYLIDPGFVHHRLILNCVELPGREMIDKLIERLPKEPEWQLPIRVDHVYSEVLLTWCEARKAPPLSLLLEEVEAGGASPVGKIFCSTETLLPCTEFGVKEYATSTIAPSLPIGRRVELQYKVSRVKADTLKLKLAGGHRISVVAALDSVEDGVMTFRPLLMGFPLLLKRTSDEIDFSPLALGYEFYEHQVEDFAQLSRVAEFPLPDGPSQMQQISEAAFKQCLAKILGDEPSPDWGGETSDYFTSHLTIGGKQKTAAFLLKGPADFRPMRLKHLGKNGDQIIRLAREPADILVVQHCHDIRPEVRETLRAFAVQPGRPRRYCCIDGRESLRLLQAYGLLEKALALTLEEQAQRRGEAP